MSVLDRAGDLSGEHVRLVAATVGVSERTVWRWVQTRRRPPPRTSPGFGIDAELRVRLAYWRGNASALHCELVERERGGGPRAPSLKTLHRAIRRDVPPGDLAGLREGERARRKFDVYLQRPATYRNAAWEGDHVEAPVQVDVDGVAVRGVGDVVRRRHARCDPRCCGDGGESEPGQCAGRAAGVGAAPCAVRAGRWPSGRGAHLPGKDFLSGTVQEALGAFAVRVVPLPGYTRI